MTRLIKKYYLTVVNIYQCRTELRSPSLKLSDRCKHVHTVVHIDLLYTVKNGAENTTQRYSVSEIKEESRDKQYIFLLDIKFCHTVKLVKSGWVNIIFLLHWNTLPIVNNRLLTCWQLWLGFFSEYAWHMICQLHYLYRMRQTLKRECHLNQINILCDSVMLSAHHRVKKIR